MTTTTQIDLDKVFSEIRKLLAEGYSYKVDYEFGVEDGITDYAAYERIGEHKIIIHLNPPRSVE